MNRIRIKERIASIAGAIFGVVFGYVGIFVIWIFIKVAYPEHEDWFWEHYDRTLSGFRG